MKKDMRNYISLTVLILSGLFVNMTCDQALDSPQCNAITLGKPFTAKIGQEWCIPDKGWKITFGPFIEDSRCNVPGIECFWEGRFVMGATIDNGETVQETFEARYTSNDTLYSGPYTIILKTVYPELRTSMEAMDTSKYSFDILVK